MFIVYAQRNQSFLIIYMYKMTVQSRFDFTWAFRSTSHKTTEPKYNCSFILLNNLCIAN
jgi:hypothetical protein